MDRAPPPLAQYNPNVNRAGRSSLGLDAIGGHPLLQGLKILKIQIARQFVGTLKAEGTKTYTSTFWSASGSVWKRLARASSRKTED